MGSIFKFRSKFFLFLIAMLRYPISKNDQEFGRLEKYLTQDVLLCPECFTPKSVMCLELNSSFDFIYNSASAYINAILRVRSKNVHFGFLKGNPMPIVAKYSGNTKISKTIETEFQDDTTLNQTEMKLKRLYLESKQIDGFQYCPRAAVEGFLHKLLPDTSSLLEAWMHVNVNVATIVLPTLNAYGFPVPRYIGHCGLTLYESYDGEPLYQFKEVQFTTKLKIARKLLQAAIKFTKGFDDYRIYLTDLTLDNVVYDLQSDHLSFIDLDSIIIVDTLYNRSGMRTAQPDSWNTVHKYEEITCEGCFAYVQEDLCTHRKSDMNIFAVCQLLHQDLHGDTTKGYLKPLPHIIDKDFPFLLKNLKDCVRCGTKCTNRIHYAHRLIQTFSLILNRFSPK